jgi:hypothetical protein
VNLTFLRLVVVPFVFLISPFDPTVVLASPTLKGTSSSFKGQAWSPSEAALGHEQHWTSDIYRQERAFHGSNPMRRSPSSFTIGGWGDSGGAARGKQAVTALPPRGVFNIVSSRASPEVIRRLALQMRVPDMISRCLWHALEIHMLMCTCWPSDCAP